MNFTRDMRFAPAQRAADNAGGDLVLEVAFASDEPYERWWGIEKLVITDDAIRMERLNDGAPVLYNHHWDALRGTHVAGSVRADPDGRLRGQIKLTAATEAGRETIALVESGVLSKMSVGYQIHRVIEQSTSKSGEKIERTLDGRLFAELLNTRSDMVRSGDRAAFQRFIDSHAGVIDRAEDDTPVYLVIDWEPLENSLVTVPADNSVGVGRSALPRVAPPAEPVTEPEPNPAERGQQRPADGSATRAVKEPAMAEVIDNGADQMQRILKLADQFRQYLPAVDKLATEHLRGGKSADEFQESIAAAIVSQHTDTRALDVGLSDKEIQRYSIARAIGAQITGDWSKAGLERTASDAFARQFGASPSGFFVPMDAFRRDFTAGTAAEAGNLIAADLRADMFTDVLRKSLVLADLGVTFLPGLSSNIDIPRKTAASAVQALTEVATASETAPVTAQISLTPKRISAFIEYSKQAIIQSSMAIEPMLRMDLLDSLAVQVEDYAINGSGTAPVPRGVRNVSGIGSVVGGTNGLALAWSHIVGLETAAANANAANTSRAGYLINTKSVGTCKTTQKAANLPFLWDGGDRPLNGHRAAISNNVPSNLTKGTSTGVCSSVLFSADWGMEIIAMFGAVDITVDPMTRAKDGLVVITLNHFMDTGNRMPGCFAVMDDALTP